MKPWVNGLLKALKLAGCDSIHLVGHSAGFLIALEAANALGDKLKTLTAVASAVQLYLSMSF